MLTIRQAQPQDARALAELWRVCGLTRPWNDPQRDTTLKLDFQPQGAFVGLRDDQLIASVFAGYEGHRGWINYLAVHPEHQQQGFGRVILQHAEDWLRSLDCPKINLQVRADNAEVIAFYESLGYTQDPCISMGKRLDGILRP